MTTHPISVIIPARNRIHTLPRALDSVLNQTCPAAEIIVIDDGSVDSTGAVLQDRYPGIRYIYQPHSGVSAARNTGIRAARHPWLALLDSDDEWQPCKLEMQTALLDQDSHLLMAHTDEIWIRNGARIKQMKKHRKRGGYIFKYCLPLCIISPSAVIIHKRVFEDVGFFDESMPACEDYDMWLRICCKYEVGYCGEALTIKYGGHNDQLSKQYPYMDRFRIRSIAGVLQNCNLGAADRNHAIAMLHRKIKIYLAGAAKHGNTDCVSAFEQLLDTYSLPDSIEVAVS